MNITECAEWLLGRDNFLLLTHRRPDGDTLGSAVALANALRSRGKTIYLFENPEVTDRYLSYVQDFYAPAAFVPEFVISVDLASPSMMPVNVGEHAGSVALSIDHHPSNSNYAEHTLLDHTRAACGEIVYELLELLGFVDAVSATALYIAVATDTGCFSYDNTTANTFHVASKLVEYGADAAYLNRYLFRSKSRGRIAIEGTVFSSMEFLFDNRAAVVVLTNEMIKKAGASEDDMENIAAFPVMVDGIEAGALIRELPDGRCKISMRSGASVDSNAICARFGGGGHSSAAGFATSKPTKLVRELLIPVIGEFLGYDGNN